MRCKFIYCFYNLHFFYIRILGDGILCWQQTDALSGPSRHGHVSNCCGGDGLGNVKLAKSSILSPKQSEYRPGRDSLYEWKRVGRDYVNYYYRGHDC